MTDNDLADVMLVSKNDIKSYMDDQIKYKNFTFYTI
jgi:hypothetical protein